MSDLISRAWCLDTECDWTWHGADADSQAAKHGKRTGHATNSAVQLALPTDPEE